MLQIALFLSLVLLLVPPYEGKRRLDHHVHHYEPLQYDADTLMHHHNRLMRHSHDLFDHRRDDRIKLEFTTHGRHFDLRLKPDDSTHIHKDFELIVDGKPHSRTLFKSVSYIGHDVNDPHTEVHGNLAFGVFDGTIHTEDDIYHIEPANRYFKENKGFHSIAYRHSNIRMQSDKSHHNRHPQSTCGVTDNAKRHFLAQMSSSSSDSTHSSRFLKRHVQKQTRNPNKVSCWINVVADSFFYDHITTSSADRPTRVAQASSIIRNIVAGTSLIYKRVDFNSDNRADGVTFAIQKLTINTTEGPGQFANRFFGVESLLNKFSENDWSDYCLSYIFTYRDFENGVLGLAFVGDEVNRGGICDGYTHGKTLNTGVVTMVNYDRRVSNGAALLTFAHETGHNFGSEHDTGSCSPQDNGYIMTAYANDGTRSNNHDFSSCSITDMNTIIGLKAQNPTGCFRLSNDTCGNFLLDEGEECDCGVEFDDNTKLCFNDPCCNGSSCRIANVSGAVCSPQSSSCCAQNCTIIPASANQTCLTETDCAYSQVCNGSSPECPRPISKTPTNGSSNVACNGGSNYCVNGECTGSICIPLLLPDCECIGDDVSCHVCCRLPNGTCASTITLAQENNTARSLLPRNEGKVYIIGFPCNNFTGYCDFRNVCRPVKEDGALKAITDFITGNEAIRTALTWVIQYWWAGIIAGVAILVVLFVIVLVCHFILPRPEHMKKRIERRRTIRQNKRQSRRQRRVNTSDYWMKTTHESNM